jgi:hypothetical protein
MPVTPISTIPSCRESLAIYERIVMSQPRAARDNLDRLRLLHAEHPEIRVVCSHDDHGHDFEAA